MGFRLAFSKARRHQLWVPLVEKAMAKLHGAIETRLTFAKQISAGSYGALKSGTVDEGLSILTGYPCETMYLKVKCFNELRLIRHRSVTTQRSSTSQICSGLD